MRNERTRNGRTRRTALAMTAALAVGALGIQIASAPDAGAEEESAPVFMFVHTADDFEADAEAKTLRLVNVAQQVLYFSDRPDRIAGHLTMDQYLDEWAEVEDDFNDDPPNAALSVYEGEATDNSIAVVEIMNPVLDGADIVYDYALLKGEVPRDGGATALFIDRIGIGGGVGVGFHGVGVGVRGPGVAGWAK